MRMVEEWDNEALEKAWRILKQGGQITAAGVGGWPSNPATALGGGGDGPPGAPPHYRCPSDMPGMMCGNCAHRNEQGYCTKHEFFCEAGCVCNDWAGREQMEFSPDDPVDPTPPNTVMPHDFPGQDIDWQAGGA